VDRLACVDAPAFALQLLLRRRPQWRAQPAAVVERDAPHGAIVAVNEAARSCGVLPGMRYAAALAMCPQLCATEVAADEVAAGVEQTCELLRQRSPHVEPSAEEPGVFWLDARGLEAWIECDEEVRAERAASSRIPTGRIPTGRIPTGRAATDRARASQSPQNAASPLTRWARSTRTALAAAGLECALVVGFSHFGVYAVAKALRGARVLVFDREDDEQDFARRVPLRRLALEPRTRAELEQLGIETIDDFLRLPEAGLRLRYGEELAQLHALASRSRRRELAPRPPGEWPTAAVDLDFPTNSLEALIALCGELLTPLLTQLARCDERAAALKLRLQLEDGSALEERLEPAQPTLAGASFERLLRLRLARVQLARGVERLSVSVRPTPALAPTSELFALARGRETAAALRAFAALRAAFGEGCVVRAQLVSAHLPEAGYCWVQTEALSAPRPLPGRSPALVRRILLRPLPLPSRTRHEEDGWLLRGVSHGPVLRLHGPYPLQGGWWRAEVARDYHYAEMHNGALLWIYFDRVRRRWFLQGSVS